MESRPGARARVVLADDTAEIRSLVRAAIDMDGRFEVVAEAEDGQQATDAVVAHEADAIVLDLAMPNVDGLQAIPMIRDARPDTQILVLSGFNAAQMEAEALRLGAAAYVEKGTSIRAIVELLANLCADVIDVPPPDEPDVELVAEEDELDAALSYLGHELRTPIAVIRGLTATLARAVDAMEPARIRESSRAIERSVINLERLVDALVDAHALDAHGLDLAPEALPVAEVVQGAIDELLTLHDTSIHHQADGDTVARVDPVRIRQVVTNLLGNAVKFGPDDQPVHVRTEVVGDDVVVAVRDHGPGIPAHLEHQLFERFARLGSDQKGTGLGLYISRGIAEAHGGRLVYDAPEGGGARFKLYLPRGS